MMMQWKSTDNVANIGIMDSTITNNSNEYLQPYLEVLQNASNGSTIRSVVMKLLSDPLLFNGYDEIKYCIVQNSKTATTKDDEKVLSTLDLFSYGTYNDYRNGTFVSSVPTKALEEENEEKTETMIETTTKVSYLSLNENQITKLRQLTALQVLQDWCQNNNNHTKSSTSSSSSGGSNPKGVNIPYSVLQQALHVSTIREMEEIIATCIASKIIEGKLSQKQSSFLVTRFVQSRDIHPNTIVTKLLPTIQLFKQRLINCQNNIQKEQSMVTSQIVETHNTLVQYHQQNILLNNNNNSNTTIGGGSSSVHLSGRAMAAAFLARGGSAAVFTSISAAASSSSTTPTDPMDVEFTATNPAVSSAAERRQKRSRGGFGTTTTTTNNSRSLSNRVPQSVSELQETKVIENIPDNENIEDESL